MGVVPDVFGERTGLNDGHTEFIVMVPVPNGWKMTKKIERTHASLRSFVDH